MEAAHERAPVLKVRDSMTGASARSGATLFLDALDEYRIDGQPSDKIYGLAHAIDLANVERWRLSCRSEDWRKDADIAPIKRTTKGAQIVVAQLLPLDVDEASAVLSALGESDPEAFLQKAESMGAGGFVENPLSLALLHKAVSSGGLWPATRHELFENAVLQLVYERNAEHKSAERGGPESIIRAAGEVCLFLLSSGARAIWRSNDQPPTDRGDTRGYVSAHALPINRDLLKDVLDTPLFRGEGETFEPIHRTVAEFLAGQALAAAVAGAGGKAAFPLSRALTLITGEDGKPPTELRGLYAWFAAHLATSGDADGALHLIELDAVTVLAYGDAAVFNTAARQAIVLNLDRDDPYLRAPKSASQPSVALPAKI